MHHIFISYVRDDAPAVDDLTQRLRSAGLTVWLDRQSIAPGQRWKNAIRSAIQNGMFFIACFSSAYNRRTKTYMNEELIIAVEELRQRPEDTNWFIPVLLDECEVPDRQIGGGETLRSIQYVSMSPDPDYGFQRLLMAICPQATAGTEIRPTGCKPTTVQGAAGNVSERILAVDFGTSVSCAALFDIESGPRFIQSHDGHLFVPSVITFLPNMDYYVGAAAINMAHQHPDTTVTNVKRHLGSGKTIKLANAGFSPETIAGLIIASLRDDAMAYAQQEFSKVVAAVPGNFGIVETNALSRAFKLAGLDIARMVTEPEAASLLLGTIVPPEKIYNAKVLVLDLGGGTFDVAVQEIGEGVWETKSVVGRNDLGGSDFDQALVDFIIDQLSQEYFDLPRLLTGLNKWTLHQEAIRAKIALGINCETTIVIPSVEFPGQGIRDLSVSVTRDQFRTITRHLTDEIRNCIWRALELADFRANEINLVVLGGQGTKLFSVVEIIEHMFLMVKVLTKYQEGAVINGLCQYAGVLEGNQKDTLLLDTHQRPIMVRCLPRSQAIAENADASISVNEAENSEFLMLLEAGTTLPTIKIYTLAVMGTGPITLSIVEGDTIRKHMHQEVASINIPIVHHGNSFNIQIESDARRTIELWIEDKEEKVVRGFQINNPFFSQPMTPSADKLNANIRGFQVLPVEILGWQG